MSSNEKSKFLQRHSMPENGRIAIFGAGIAGKILHKLLNGLRIKVDMFLDNNSLIWEQFIDGTICKKPKSILENANETLIIISVQSNPESIRDNLLIDGFKNIILFCDIEDELQKDIYNLLDDSFMDLTSYMAVSGIGTDKCLEKGFLPVSIHFYQPIPDIKNLERRDIWSKVSSLGGIAWEPDRFLANMKDISQFKPEKDWNKKPSENAMEFCLENTSFSYICASFLYGMIRKNKPKRIIEIGSGNSSKVIFKALIDNGNSNIKYTIIDPYCAFEQNNFMPFNVKIMRMPVEESDISLFKELGENDILFIDSSHTVRIGGDVNFEILDILPILAPGVTVHFHDIAMPYEYEKIYATNPKFRVFWTESYLLQAFLAFNSQYEILLPAAYLCREKLETVKECYPNMTKSFDWSSSSFWIRRL